MVNYYFTNAWKAIGLPIELSLKLVALKFENGRENSHFYEL